MGLEGRSHCRAHMGLLSQIPLSLRDSHHPHGHLVCEKCEHVLDIEAGLIDHLAQAVKLKTGFALDCQHLTLVGLCQTCGQTEAAA